ncbi:unnamed protein product [Brassicogethes aeneus]|uniref:BESS domain-containing protein n=1 Tax=Brassicogethes aeneus TaxID=1431903 RepID=A0A9P0FPT4_BRAAE|nr:unnamed protein product [Brassicogethes aeneus]
MYVPPTTPKKSDKGLDMPTLPTDEAAILDQIFGKSAKIPHTPNKARPKRRAIMVQEDDPPQTNATVADDPGTAQTRISPEILAKIGKLFPKTNKTDQEPKDKSKKDAEILRLKKENDRLINLVEKMSNQIDGLQKQLENVMKLLTKDQSTNQQISSMETSLQTNEVQDVELSTPTTPNKNNSKKRSPDQVATNRVPQAYFQNKYIHSPKQRIFLKASSPQRCNNLFNDFDSWCKDLVLKPNRNIPLGSLKHIFKTSTTILQNKYNHSPKQRIFLKASSPQRCNNLFNDFDSWFKNLVLKPNRNIPLKQAFKIALRTMKLELHMIIVTYQETKHIFKKIVEEPDAHAPETRKRFERKKRRQDDILGEKMISLLEKSNEKATEEEDPDRAFLISLLPTLKGFDEDKKLQFRAEVLRIMMDIKKVRPFFQQPENHQLPPQMGDPRAHINSQSSRPPMNYGYGAFHPHPNYYTTDSQSSASCLRPSSAAYASSCTPSPVSHSRPSSAASFNITQPSTQSHPPPLTQLIGMDSEDLDDIQMLN